MSRSITISYNLNPPAGSETAVANLSASKTQEFTFNATDSTQKTYYEGLHGAIQQARDTMGEELTAWRDAVGSLEQNKETKKTLKYEAGEEDEEDEEE